MTFIETNDVITLTPRLRYREVDGEGVLVHLESGRVLVVNEVALHIIKQLDQPQTQNQLVASIVAEFKVGTEQAESDLLEFLQQLDSEQVLLSPEQGR